MIGDAIWQALWRNTLAGGGMIVAFWLLRAALRRRTPPYLWVALWGVCLLRLLTPVRWSSAWSLYALLPRGSGRAMTGAAAVPATGGAEFLHLIYLAGAAVTALALAAGWMRTRRAVRRARARQDARLPRGVRLRVGAVAGAPLTFGLLRPVIVLPPELEDEALVLAHECVHARRRDNLWHYLLGAALVLHWYNPAVWLLARLLRADIEFACDRAVLRRLGDARREDYAGALIRLSARARTAPFSRAFAARRVRRRVEAVMRLPRATVLGVLLALALAAGATMTLATGPLSAPASLAAGETLEDTGEAFARKYEEREHWVRISNGVLTTGPEMTAPNWQVYYMYGYRDRSGTYQTAYLPADTYLAVDFSAGERGMLRKLMRQNGVARMRLYSASGEFVGELQEDGT